jgi:predicted transcriptional regulator
METQAVTFRLPRDIYEKLRQTAFERERGASMNSIVVDAVTEWLRRYAS